jgi:hypothetical protein
MCQIDRRHFMAAMFTAPWLLPRAAWAQEAESAESGPTLDLHVHLVGNGDTGSGCRLSPAITGKWWFGLLVRKLGIYRRARSFDEGYVQALAETISCSGLDKAVVLAQDAVYDCHGQPDWGRTAVYVPNDYLFEVVGRFRQRMVPCIGLNPDRAGAIEEMERCHQKGARLLKIYPPVHGVDLSDKKFIRFFRRCAELKMVVMVHTGHPKGLGTGDPTLANPSKLALALDQGCTVVACHSGTSGPDDYPDMVPDFLAMIRKYPNLWGDTAALCSRARSKNFLRLLADEVAPKRFLYGTDFPFPPSIGSFRSTLGLRNTLQVRRLDNPIAQDFAIQQMLGVGRVAAGRSHRLAHGQHPNPEVAPTA